MIKGKAYMIEFWVMVDYGSIQSFYNTEAECKDNLKSQVEDLKKGTKYGYKIYKIIESKFDVEK